MKLKPVDSNAASHLIRCALGGELRVQYALNTSFNIAFTVRYLKYITVVLHYLSRRGPTEAFVSFDWRSWGIVKNSLRNQVLDIFYEK
jgi:hypothetical protein